MKSAFAGAGTLSMSVGLVPTQGALSPHADRGLNEALCRPLSKSYLLACCFVVNERAISALESVHTHIHTHRASLFYGTSVAKWGELRERTCLRSDYRCVCVHVLVCMCSMRVSGRGYERWKKSAQIILFQINLNIQTVDQYPQMFRWCHFSQKDKSV